MVQFFKNTIFYGDRFCLISIFYSFKKILQKHNHENKRIATLKYYNNKTCADVEH